jgi:hypothetical protein
LAGAAMETNSSIWGRRISNCIAIQEPNNVPAD